jgi:hypothetical protein
MKAHAQPAKKSAAGETGGWQCESESNGENESDLSSTAA